MRFTQTFLILSQLFVAVILTGEIIGGEFVTVATLGVLSSFLGLLTCFAWMDEKRPK